MTIELKNTSFKYEEGKYIFSNLSFNLEDGEVLAVMGCNGVGKTTLLKCIMGFYQLESGECLINGDISNKFSNKMSYVPQAKKLSFNYRVIDFIAFGRSSVNPYFASPSLKDYEISEKIMAELNISHLIENDINKLSGGELQMVYIAKALVSMPSLLILDEPESNLDYKNQIKLLNILESLSREKGVTIIINSHYINNVLKIADKCLILKEDEYYFGSVDKIEKVIIEKFFNVKVYEVEYMLKNSIKKHFILY